MPSSSYWPRPKKNSRDGRPMDTGHRYGARAPRLRGTVKHFDAISGYGFIRRIGLQDVFFHIGNVEGGDRLERYDNVVYDLIETDDGRYRAERVRKIELE
jgi:cold shock CspA family protein